MNSIKRKALALAAVLLLSVPSAIGVQHALAPTRGDIAGWLAAAGFEFVYLSTAVLILTSDLRRYAARVALAAVAAAVLLNTIADYSARVPTGLTSAALFVATFDALALGLSLIESLPLAALAYSMAVLLHRLAEAETTTQEPVSAPAGVPVLAQSTAESTERETARLSASGVETSRKAHERTYHCKRCGNGPMSFADLGRHSRTCTGGG